MCVVFVYIVERCCIAYDSKLFWCALNGGYNIAGIVYCMRTLFERLREDLGCDTNLIVSWSNIHHIRNTGLPHQTPSHSQPYKEASNIGKT